MSFNFRCKLTRPDGSHAVNVDKKVTLGWKTAVVAGVIAVAGIVVAVNKA